MTFTTEEIARVCHQANGALCVVLGDQQLPDWDRLDPMYQQSNCKGVEAVMTGATPKQLHESWIAERVSQGWVFGTPLNRTAKVHPNLVPYDQLPVRQHVKDQVFHAIVTAMTAKGDD